MIAAFIIGLMGLVALYFFRWEIKLVGALERYNQSWRAAVAADVLLTIVGIVFWRIAGDIDYTIQPNPNVELTALAILVPPLIGLAIWIAIRELSTRK